MGDAGFTCYLCNLEKYEYGECEDWRASVDGYYEDEDMDYAQGGSGLRGARFIDQIIEERIQFEHVVALDGDSQCVDFEFEENLIVQEEAFELHCRDPYKFEDSGSVAEHWYRDSVSYSRL